MTRQTILGRKKNCQINLNSEKYEFARVLCTNLIFLLLYVYVICDVYEMRIACLYTIVFISSLLNKQHILAATFVLLYYCPFLRQTRIFLAGFSTGILPLQT